LAHISAGLVWQAGVKPSREIMAETTLPHCTIGAALALVATAVAAEPMGEATRHLDSMTWVKDGTPVVILYSVQNGGHAMPLEGEDLDSPVVIWDFFSKLPSR